MTVKMVADPAKIEEEPPWLLKLVELGHFYRTCESHPSNVCNFYCIHCMGGASCQQCKSKHAKCAGRNIPTTDKASGAATLRTNEMKTIWDISDICIYIINSQQIVFIQKKGGNERYACETICRRKKGEATTDQACTRKSCEDAHADSTIEAEQEGESSAPRSCRKRPRKGIPHRAPSF